jgi:hypothetical protein
VIGWLQPIYWATFSPAFCGSSSPVGMGDAFFLAFVPAAKAASGAYEEGDRGHAHHHQSLARGIGAVALGGLC